MKVRYEGEFGPELQTVLPFAYYLRETGGLEETIGCLDTSCFYYFSENHKEEFTKRKFLTPSERIALGIPNPTEHCFFLKRDKWRAPPYAEVFKNDRFRWDKETLVILNKYNIEWDGEPVNYLDLGVLEELFQKYSQSHQIIYARPGIGDIVGDNSDILDLKDAELLKKFPDVIGIGELHRENSDMNFNELQLQLFANCRKFISVQGGNSVLASYFGGWNIIYIQRGKELWSGDFFHFRHYAGTKVVVCRDRESLRKAVQVVYSLQNGPLACARRYGLYWRSQIGVVCRVVYHCLTRVLARMRRTSA